MSGFYAHASRKGYVVISSGEGRPAFEDLGTDTDRGAPLGRLVTGRFFEKPWQRRFAAGSALAAVAVTTTAAIALSVPGGKVAATPGIGSTREVTLEAVTESGHPYHGLFTVRVNGPGGATEDIFADLPKTRVDLFNGNDTLATNQGSWPAEDPDGSGIFNKSEVAVTDRTRTVIVTVPGTDQYTNTGNVSIVTNTNPQSAGQNQAP